MSGTTIYGFTGPLIFSDLELFTKPGCYGYQNSELCHDHFGINRSDDMFGLGPIEAKVVVLDIRIRIVGTTLLGLIGPITFSDLDILNPKTVLVFHLLCFGHI